MTLVGHKGAVTCLAVNSTGMVLASGGSDTNVVLWDLVAERGLFRLRGHKDAITGVKFVEKDFSASAPDATANTQNGGGAGGADAEGTLTLTQVTLTLTQLTTHARAHTHAHTHTHTHTHPG